jgi:hypothetical protein
LDRHFHHAIHLNTRSEFPRPPLVHAVLIDGTMEAISKVALSVLVVAATAKVILDMIGAANRRRSKGTLD